MQKKSLLQRAGKLIHEDGYAALAWKILWKLPVLRSLVLWRLVATTKTIVTLENALEFAFSRRFGALITPSQIRSEIQALCEIVRERRPRTVLEIGTEHGGAFFLFSRAADPDAFLVSVDLPRKDLKPWRSLCVYLGKKGQNVSILDGDSHASSTVEKLNQVLGGRKVDFLFIDGDHSYEGVKKDFQMYNKLVRSAGMIVLHDICHHPPETKSEVDKFWNEIKDEYDHEELVEDWNQGWAGIGILHT